MFEPAGFPYCGDRVPARHQHGLTQAFEHGLTHTSDHGPRDASEGNGPESHGVYLFGAQDDSSLFLLDKQHRLRVRIARLVDSVWFNRAMWVVILLSTAQLVLEIELDLDGKGAWAWRSSLLPFLGGPSSWHPMTVP